MVRNDQEAGEFEALYMPRHDKREAFGMMAARDE